MSSSRLLLVALALLGALLALPLGAGETIIVDASGNGDYTTITAGLEAAADGDVVRVWNGTYVESSLLIEKQVTLRGNGSATTLQPQQGDDFITITSDDVELSYLHLESPDGNAWALVSGSNDGLRLESLNISGKYLIRLDRSDGGLLANLTLTVTEASGRALELDSSDGNIIRDSVFAEPASGSGYGIMLEDSDDNLLRNCTVSSFGYYGIYLYNSARDNTILDSSADSNGDAGLMLEVAYNTVVRNSSFSGSPNGSGLIVTSATGVALDNLTVADNGDETSDYGLSVSSSSQITLKFSSFSNNSGMGTYIYNSNNIVIYSNRMVDHQSHTLQLWTVNDALVARNILESGSGDVVSAVSLYYTTDTWIENNSVTQQGDGPEDSGIGLRYSYGNTIYNNSIGDSDATGIRLRDDSNSNFVLDNHLLRLKGYGIQVSDGNRPSLYNLVSGNILEEIDQYALYVATKGAWNTFSGNAISDSEAQGIGVFGADNTFSGNSISGGLAAAIIDDGQRNSFTGNSIDATGQTAIIVYASGGTYSNNSITNGLEGFWISGSDNLFVNETVIVSSTALKFVNGANNIFRESSLSGDVTLESGSTGNRLNATSLQGSISCDSSSQLFIADNIVVEALNADLGTPFTGVHLRFKADGEVVYATPHFNGSDETTGADGRIAPQMLVHTSYDGSSDPESTEFSLAYAFHLRENATQFSASGPHLETVLVPDIWNYGLVQNLQTGEEYGLISDAVEDASEGDELLVWPSLYEESITVDKRLTITGLGPEVRVLGGSGPAFLIEADGTVLQNLSIENSSVGLVVNADDVILANLTISDISSEIEDEYALLWDYTAGHTVVSVAISADGKYIAAGSLNDKVYLFEKDSSTPLWSYDTGNWVWSVAVSADGEYIVAGSANGKVYLFDKDSSTPLWSYGAGDDVITVTISADGEYIAAGDQEGYIYLFDKDSSTPLWSYLTGDMVYSVSISADGEYIAAGSEDVKVYLFDKDSSTPLWIYDSEGVVRSVAISADGEYIAAGSEDANVYLFDKDSSTPLWSYETESVVRSVAISADGEYIVTGSAYSLGGDQNVYAFDKDSSTPLWSYETGETVNSVAISADGEFIAAGSRDDKVYLFEKDSSTPLWSHTTGDDMAVVAISADGAYVAAGSYDQKIYALQHRLSMHGTGIAISTVVAAEVSELQVRDVTVRNTTSHGIATLSAASDFVLERVHVSQTGSESLLLKGSGHLITTSSFTDLTIEGGGDNLLRNSTIANNLQLSGSTTGNRALDTTFGTIDCQPGSSLAIEYRLTVELRTVKGNGSGLNVELLEGGAVFYATSAFGGSDARSDGAGRLPEQVVAGLLYNGSSTPEQVLTTVRVQFNGLQESSFIVSQDSLKRVWLNLPPQVSIKGVSPSPAIQGDLRQPVDGATLAWWPLDEGSGTVSADGSGNGHNLTLGPTPSWAAGHDGSAVLFDGQYIYLAGPRLGLSTLTIEFWFNTTGANGTLLSDREGSDTHWNHHLYFVEGEPRFSHTQGGMSTSLAAGVQFNDGAWHHLAVVRSSDETSLWVDGVLRASTPSGAPDLSQSDTWLGMSPGGGTAYAGLLDSVRISTVARHPGDFLIGGGTVILLGQASDSDGSVTNWSWYSSEDGLLGYGARLEIGVDSLSPAIHSITLQVIDSNGSASQDSTSLDVMQRPGVVILEAPSLVQEGTPVNLSGNATGGMQAWEWWSDRDGLLGSVAAIQLSTLSNGTHNLALRVQAFNGLWSENATAQLLVNGRPRLYNASLSTLSLDRTSTLTLEADTLDDMDSGEQLLLNASYRLDGTGIWETEYLLPPGWGAGKAVFTFAPDLTASPGSYEFRIQAQDAHGGSSGWIVLPQPVELVNLPPQVFASQTPAMVVSSDGGVLQFEATFDDPDGTVQQLQWISSLDGLLSTNASFTVDASSLSAGNHTITLRVQDNDGAWSETSFTLEVRPAAAPETFLDNPGDLLIVAAALLLGAVLVGGGMLLRSRIQAAEPQQVTRIINIQDSVSPAGGGHPPYRVEELYLIYNDGRLITGQSLEETAIDQDIMGSMLTAINDFVQDSFRAAGELGSIDYGDNCILIERGQQAVLAAVVFGEETRELRSQVANALRQVESRFSSELTGWNGDVDLLSGTRDILQPLLDATREVSREMIDEYIALQKVGLRAGWEHVAGHVRVQVAVRNHDSQPLTEVHLKLERTASLLELVAVQPETEQTGSGVHLGEIEPHGSRELLLYFEPRGEGPASLALRLDYHDSEGRSAGVTMTVFADAEVLHEDDPPDGSALQRLLEETGPIEVASAEQVPVAEAEVVAEPVAGTEDTEESEPADAAEESTAGPGKSKQPANEDDGSDEMDDLLAKLKELDD